MRRWVPLLLVVTVAGCGGSPTTTTPAKPATTAKKPAAAAKAPTAASKRPGASSVSIENFDYNPKTLAVPKGTTVRWLNKDASNHTVTGEDGAKIKLGNVDQGKSVQMRFTAPGTYKYYCEYHPNMHARIVVH